jgi:epoxyqueuosine reductase
VNGADLADAVQREAAALGFDRSAFTPVRRAPHADFFAAWLAAGRAGEMAYLERNVEKRLEPALLAAADETFRTIVVLGVDYRLLDLPPALRADPSRGIVASYAWGDDYHEILKPLLYELDARIRRHSGRTTPGKCLVDTGPVLERDWAAAAGLGFTGKNCCTIVPGAGSWVLLATILVPEEIGLMGQGGGPVIRRIGPIGSDPTDTAPPPPRSRPATCGGCTRCLDACPTHAFAGPYDLDPRRCISYWTIEARGAIPRELRRDFGNRIFGCDICQEVCPYNRRLPAQTPRLAGLRARQDRMAPPLLEGFDPAFPYWLDEGAFAERWRRSPVKRARRGGMLRNVCVALGNWGEPAAAAALMAALHDPLALVRGHAAWALGEIVRRHGHAGAREALEEALKGEPEQTVRREIYLACGNAG